MFRTLVNAWKIPDLRKKILFTLLLLVVFRFGSVIPVPGLARDAMAVLLNGSGTGLNSLFDFFNTIGGGAFEQATIFAMSISPYINSSIIMNLLTIAIPALEKLSKEGEEGQKKIAKYTRYVTVILAFMQAAGLYVMLTNYQVVEAPGTLSFITITLTFTAGTAFLMWLGEQITDKGIGNGISLLIFAGIVARLDDGVKSLWSYMQGNSYSWSSIAVVIGFLVLMLLIIGFVVLINDGERRIPVQYAKRVQGRKMYGGQATHIPLKVCMAGVIPIIFAMSILSFPQTIVTMFGATPSGFWASFLSVFQQKHWVYNVLYFLLIIFFTYFYTSIQFNPIEMANNMKMNGGFVPGIRPGKPTSDYITKIVNKVTLIGAFALGIVALLPNLIGLFTKGLNIAMGGTSVLILVSVALETVKQLESQMLMRHYKGFLE